MVGLVFVDENLNGKPGPGEERPSGLVIESDGEQAVMGSDGRFQFYPQPAGICQLRIINLSDEYRVAPHTVSFEVRARETKIVRIRLVRSVPIGGVERYPSCPVWIQRPGNELPRRKRTGYQEAL